MATAEFSKFAGILSAALSQNHLLGFETAKLDLSLSELWEFVMDREAWRGVIRGVAKSRKGLSD